MTQQEEEKVKVGTRFEAPAQPLHDGQALQQERRRRNLKLQQKNLLKGNSTL